LWKNVDEKGKVELPIINSNESKLFCCFLCTIFNREEWFMFTLVKQLGLQLYFGLENGKKEEHNNMKRFGESKCLQI
jgi:hypothetical protein